LTEVLEISVCNIPDCKHQAHDVCSQKEQSASQFIHSYAKTYNVDAVFFPQGSSEKVTAVMERIFARSEAALNTHHGKICLKQAAEILNMLIQKRYWHKVLKTTAYPHQFVVALLFSLPASNSSDINKNGNAWDVLHEWLPQEILHQESRHLNMLNISDGLFGIYWRELNSVSCDSWAELSSAILKHKPLFKADFFYSGNPITALTLPDLELF
jgi:hypothetical protein